MKLSAKGTMNACFIGYIVQAIVNNFVPLLFVTFQNTYDIPLSNITLLITLNFGIQLFIDLISPLFIDRIGYKTSIVIAHICATLGLGMLTFLPDLLSNHFLGILLCVIVYAIGGGLIEVLISPIMEATPSENKEKAMSLLHSFYCWGHMGVVLLSTIFFALFGTNNWRILAAIWAIIPFANMFLFIFVPIFPLTKEGEKGESFLSLAKMPIFWALLVMMLCAGASEQAISQWASSFAEEGLGVSKAIGDLAGPMSFAFLMGLSRLIYGKFGHKMNLDRFMVGSTILCIISYLIVVFAPLPAISLIGCALVGFSVGILWPGTFSKASSLIKNGGTLLFAMLALAGDVGGSLGPSLVGSFSSLFNNDLHKGILFAIIFPSMMLLILVLTLFKVKKKNPINR